MHPKFHGFRTLESKAASYCKLFGFYNGEGGFDGKKIFKKNSHPGFISPAIATVHRMVQVSDLDPNNAIFRLPE